ncbi:hypothetical protein K4K48_002332 [Colletotrichum sp. SAR 10_66]|nr:hypothetical protein K4K48_002332 [Colletotrichum sp. SAR 10_66]
MSPLLHLTSSLSNAVEEYKIATDYFLEWLWCQHRMAHPDQATGYSFKSCAEILNAVKLVANDKVAVPASVIASLDRAIDKRRIALTIHREIEADDVEHEVFLQKLEVALEILTPLKAEMPAFDDASVRNTAHSTLNRYASLSNIETDPEPDVSVSNICEKKVSATVEEPAPVVTAMKSRCQFLVDDFIGKIAEDMDYVKIYIAMRWKIEEYWTEAAEGKLPLPVAAWLTSEAMRKIEITIPKDLKLIDTLKLVVEMGPVLQRVDSILGTQKTDTPWWEDAGSLLEYEQALNTLDHSGETADDAKTPTPKPFMPWDTQEMSTNVLPKIFRDIHRAMGRRRAIKAVEDITFFIHPRNESCEPFYAAASHLSEYDCNLASSTLLFGTDLFLSSAKAFFWPKRGDLNKENCRLRPLRLAMDMKASAKKVAGIFQELPIRPNATMQFYEVMSYFLNGLDTYIHERVFDDYHSAPWTAGCHMAEMLYQAQLVGNCLFLHKTIIASTLHLYNAIRQSPVKLPRIRIMDELCEMFHETVFLGTLPEKNFLSWYRKCVYDAKIAKISKLPHYGASGLRIDPDHRPRAISVNSAFATQHGNDHAPSPGFTGPLYGVKVPSKGPPSAASLTELDEIYFGIRDSDHIQLAKDAVLKDFQGPRAVIAVDYFSLFKFCADIMDDFTYFASMVDAAIGCIVSMSGKKEMHRDMHRRSGAGFAFNAFSKIDKELSLDSMKWKFTIHSPSTVRMPSDDDGVVAKAYGEYKLATRYVLHWLQCQHQLLIPKNTAPLTSTKAFLDAARVLQKKEIGVPTSIISSLREAITKRRQVAIIYRALGAGHYEHDIFVKRLKELLSILMPLEAASATPYSEPFPQHAFVAKNPFSLLELLVDESDNESHLSTDHAPPETNHALPQQRAPHTAPKDDKTPEISLQDDQLEVLAKIILFIYEYDALQAQLRQYATDAARGILPLPVFATLTSFPLKYLMRCVAPIIARDGHQFSDLWGEAYRLYALFPNFAASLAGRDGNVSGPVRFATLGQMIHNFDVYLATKAVEHEHGIYRTTDAVQLLPYRTRDARISAGAPREGKRKELEEDSVIVIMSTIDNIIAERSAMPKPRDTKPGALYRLDTSTPLHLAVEEFLLGMRAQDAPLQSGVIFGVDILLSTHEGFLWADDKLNVQSCHHMATQLSKEMQTSIVPVIGAVKLVCEKDCTGGFDLILQTLQHLHQDLGSYQCQTHSDMYHEAPWTAGHHMAEMLARAHLAGNMVTCGWSIVPSVLHMYNALRRSEFSLPEIPLMGQICEVFRESMFLGTIPGRNFHSHYCQATFETKISNRSLQIQKGGKDKFRTKFLHSATLDFHIHKHSMSPRVLCKIFDLPFSANPSYALKEKMRSAKEENIRSIIEKAKDALVPEFDGPVPVARINQFAIFTLCAGVLDNLSGFNRPKTNRRVKNALDSLHRGVQLVELVLETIVKVPGKLKRGHSLRDIELLQAAAEAFSSIDKTASLNQYLWKV